MRNKYKIVFLGNASVGKTTLISQIVYKVAENCYNPTIGIDFLTTQIKIKDKNVKIQLWDTAGQERFNSIIPNYTRDCFLAIIVFNLMDPISLLAVNHWIEDLVRINDEEKKVKILLVGNKKDLFFESIKNEIKKQEINIINSENNSKDMKERPIKKITGSHNSKKIEVNDMDMGFLINNSITSEKHIDKIETSKNKNMLNYKRKSNKTDINDKNSYYNENIDDKEFDFILNEKLSLARKMASDHKGKLVIASALSFEGIQDILAEIYCEIENDIVDNENIIDLGEDRIILAPENPEKRGCC